MPDQCRPWHRGHIPAGAVGAIAAEAAGDMRPVGEDTEEAGMRLPGEEGKGPAQT